MNSVAFVTVDVFTGERFGGNPLAVIPDARGLDAATMQRIAAEFGYSESTFVLPPEHPENTARVRIFTPRAEIPFAGHPNVGTAFVLAHQGQAFGSATGDMMRFEEAAGLVEIEVVRNQGQIVGARIRAPKSLEISAQVPVASVAACASIDAGSIVTGTHQPLVASVGLPFSIAELRDLDALARATPDRAAFVAASRDHPHPDDLFALFLYVRLGSDDDSRHVRARMFAPLDNVPEDPATGSAAAALGALLASLATGDDVRLELAIDQGVEMGRPSRLDVAAVKHAGVVSLVTVAGRCVPVMRGEVDLD